MIHHCLQRISSFKKLTFTALALLTIVLIAACSTTKTQEPKSVENIFNDALKLFNDEDYQEARQWFDNIKLQYPASQYADDAQYYLAEIYFKRGEYILAAYNYNSLRRIYPSSQLAKISLYKSGLCYRKLSPSFDRDQEYTNKAISTLMEFQMLFPKDSLSNEINSIISELRDKQGHREYFNGELYLKLRSPNSSVIYFDEVINNFDDTKYYEQAYVGKIQALTEMGKYSEALEFIRLYYSKFPNGKLAANVKLIEGNINKP